MIVFDNLLPDGDLKERVREDMLWQKSHPYSWKDFGAEPKHVFEEFADFVWERFKPAVKYDGYEYWTQSLNSATERKDVGWHNDKDEHLFFNKGILKTPYIGFVYYAHRTIPDGGFLEINREGDVERIQPVPNRLVIFDSGTEHRVVDITSDVRRSLVSNIWVERSSEENFV